MLCVDPGPEDLELDPGLVGVEPPDGLLQLVLQLHVVLGHQQPDLQLNQPKAPNLSAIMRTFVVYALLCYVINKICTDLRMGKVNGKSVELQ